MSTTIAAIATPDAMGGISVIRISGELSFDIADKFFVSLTGRKVSEMNGYTCAYGYIVDEGKNIDDVVLTAFKCPKSYTGENVVEISCHGGRYITKKILRIVLKNGAEPAKAGEFTKRAFFNGKLSLTQAEAVMDVISSEGEGQLRYANALKNENNYKNINDIKNELVSILGDLAAWADYPEEDVPEVKTDVLINKIDNQIDKIKESLNKYDYGRIIREGINTVICGKPNVGKSTLMNCLSGFKRSIVTDIAGTTRDIIEESIRIGDLTLRLSDTAGIRETDNVIESIGVDITYNKINEADLIFAVFDSTSELDENEKELMEYLRNKRCIGIINKVDGECNLDKETIYSSFKNVVEISAKNNQGIEKLSDILNKMFSSGEEEINSSVIVNERQKICLEKALSDLNEAKYIIENGEMLDAVTVIIESAADNLMELTGEKISDTVIENVFSRFCVGK